MVKITTLSNGLVLVVEEISHVQSAAYDLFIPGGVIHDQQQRLGSSLILAELTCRGAGHLDSRALSEAFDANGIRHSEYGSHDKYVYRGSAMAEKLDSALELVALMVTEPALPQEELPSIKSLLVQDIKALDDNPAGKAVTELNQRYYPEPYGRSSLGTIDGIENTSLDELRSAWQKQFKPGGSVLSIAGNVKSEELQDLLEKKFSVWTGDGLKRPDFGRMPAHSAHYIESDSAQLQIVLAYPAASFGAGDYYTAKVAAGILSGGMFGRLFIEVREKRGLCYSIYVRHTAAKEYGTMTAYAGTTPERAHETLEVMVKEMRSLSKDISDQELQRAKANILAACVIGEESTSSRAASNAGDWWVDKRVRSLDEISQQINKVSKDDVVEYCTSYPLDSFMLLTLGSRQLDVPAASDS